MTTEEGDVFCSLRFIPGEYPYLNIYVFDFF